MITLVPRRIFFPILKPHCFKHSCVFNSTSISYKEEKIKVGKYNINYLKVGNGPHTVLCMPGALGTIWTDFKPQVEGFDKEKFSIVAWDPPGYGKSRPPEREFFGPYFEQDVEPAFELMKALNIPKFSLMGWSYGGAASMLFTAKHPERVQKLVVWATSTFLFDREVELYKKIKDIGTWPENKRKQMIQIYGEETFAKLWAQVVDAMEIEHKTTINFSPKLKTVHCPCLILHGEKDHLVDKSHAHYIHGTIKGSRLHIYPEGRHDIHIQYAEDFNNKIQDFLLEN